jgi:hypothetical protein
MFEPNTCGTRSSCPATSATVLTSSMVLMLTAAGSPGDRVSGLGLGPTTISPSRSTSQSLSCASALSPAASPPAQARTLRAAGIELHPLRRTAIRDGRQLDLSVKTSPSSRHCCLGIRPQRLQTDNAWTYKSTTVRSPACCATTASGTARSRRARPSATARSSATNRRSPANGLRAALPLKHRQSGRTATLVRPLQPRQGPLRDRQPATDQPRSQPPRAGHLGARCDQRQGFGSFTASPSRSAGSWSMPMVSRIVGSTSTSRISRFGSLEPMPGP